MSRGTKMNHPFFSDELMMFKAFLNDDQLASLEEINSNCDSSKHGIKIELITGLGQHWLTVSTPEPNEYKAKNFEGWVIMRTTPDGQLRQVNDL